MPASTAAVVWQRARAATATGEVSYVRAGSGRRLLYLHDAGAHTLMSPAFAELTKDHDVVVVDLPGYGESAAPGDLHGTDGIADLFAQVLDQIAWPDAIVTGSSLGAWFALELALRYPERVAGLVISNSAGLHSPQEFLLDLFVAADDRHDAQTRIAQAIWDQLPPTQQQPLDSAVGTAVWSPWMQPMAAAAWCAWHPYTANPRVLALLGRLRCPVHILWGGADTLIPVRHGQMLAQAIPNATLEIVPHAGHLLLMQAPEVFAAAVRALPTATT